MAAVICNQFRVDQNTVASKQRHTLLHSQTWVESEETERWDIVYGQMPMWHFIMNENLSTGNEESG